jgi:hypothetical protein
MLTGWPVAAGGCGTAVAGFAGFGIAGEQKAVA